MSGCNSRAAGNPRYIQAYTPFISPCPHLYQYASLIFAPSSITDKLKNITLNIITPKHIPPTPHLYTLYISYSIARRKLLVACHILTISSSYKRFLIVFRQYSQPNEKLSLPCVNKENACLCWGIVAQLKSGFK